MALFDQSNQTPGAPSNLPAVPPLPPRPPALQTPMTAPPPLRPAPIPPPTPPAAQIPNSNNPNSAPAPLGTQFPNKAQVGTLTPPPAPASRPMVVIPTIPPAPRPAPVSPTTSNQQPVTRPSLPSMPPVTPSKIQEPEDIFAGSLGKGGSSYPHGADAAASIAESPARGLARKLVRLLFFALGAAVVVIAGYFGYQYFLAAKTPAPQIPTNENIPANSNLPVTVPPVTNTEPITNNQIPTTILSPQDDPNSTVDTDADGLTDYQEVNIYHTDPLKADTDNDGLNDRDEVITWHTDPLNADTDGDGFKDGDEVKNGYNPLGPGKLLPPVTK